MSTFANPLGFYCPPNGTDPHYAIEYDFRRFLAFGFYLCHQTLCYDRPEDSKPRDVYWFRNHFLATVEIALDTLPVLVEEAEQQYTGQAVSIPYQGDQDEGGIFSDDLHFSWRFLRLDWQPPHSCLLFTLDWGEDERTVWLAYDAVSDEEAAQKTLDAAVQVNEAHKT